MVKIVVKKEKEKWYKSRRIWGSVLSLGAIIAISINPTQYDVIAIVAQSVASVLGLYSWSMPKK